MSLNKCLSKFQNHRLAKKYTILMYPPQTDIHTLARLIYPNGAWVKFDNSDINKMYQQTNKLSGQNNIIYGGVSSLPSGLYASADVIYRDDRDKWNIVEAYGEGIINTDIVTDMAFKKFVFEQSNFPIRKCIALKKQSYQDGTKIDIKDLFEMVDVTKEVSAIYKSFTTVFNQNLLPVCNESQMPKSKENAYIDYSKPNSAEMEPYILSNCRILINNRTRHFKQYFWHSSGNIHRSQIDFLISNTKQADKVYIYNYEFEQAHHRQMAQMFPDKAKELMVLNEKLQEWTNFLPLPDFDKVKIESELAEFRFAYKQKHKRLWKF